MRMNGTYVTLILGGALGVLAVVLTRTNDETNKDVDSSFSAPTSVNNGPPYKVQNSPARELETEKRGAASSGNGSVTALNSIPAAAADDSKRNQDAVPPTEAFPFRISASVEERCRTRPAPTADSCKAMTKSLQEFAREKRDVEWAEQTEARIRNVVFERQDGTEIRALECKHTMCAIETESPGTYQHLSIFRQAEQETAGVVDDGDFVLAWEEDPARGSLTITVVVYTRRTN